MSSIEFIIELLYGNNMLSIIESKWFFDLYGIIFGEKIVDCLFFFVM